MGKSISRKPLGKRVGKDDRTKAKYPPGIPLYKLPLKAFLRSWPDEDGCMLLTEKQTPSEYFTPSKLAEHFTAESSECVARLGLGVSMAAASLESCAAALAVLPTSSADKKYAQSGVPAVRKLLESLRAALAVANMTNKACADASASAPHVGKLLKKLGKKDALKQQVKDFARLADTSSRMYAGAMAGLELCILAANPKAWAKKIPNESRQDKAVQKFIRKKTLESCVEAVASTNAARLEAKAPRKKRAFGESSDADACRRGGSAAESQDESETADSGSDSDRKARSPSSSSSQASKLPRKNKKAEKKSKALDTPKERPKLDVPASIALSLADEEDEVEEAEGNLDDMHLVWEESAVISFAEELQTMVENVDQKKDKFSLSGLVAMLDNVPETVLADNRLAKVLQTLKQMRRLPKKEKLAVILDSTQEMVAKAISAHDRARGAADAGLPGAAAPAAALPAVAEVPSAAPEVPAPAPEVVDD